MACEESLDIEALGMREALLAMSAFSVSLYIYIYICIKEASALLEYEVDEDDDLDDLQSALDAVDAVDAVCNVLERRRRQSQPPK